LYQGYKPSSYQKLAPKDAYPGFEGTYNNHLRFPLVDLPNSIMEILKDVDGLKWV